MQDLGSSCCIHLSGRVWSKFESARDEDLVFNCELSVSITRSDERLDVSALGLLSRVMCVASWIRTSSLVMLCPWVLSQHHHPLAY